MTGVLASPPGQRDVKFINYSLSVGGNQLVDDCNLELTQGCLMSLAHVTVDP